MVVVPPSRHTRKRAPLLFWRERWMVAFVFAAVLLVGLIATYEPVLSARTTPAEIVEAILWGVLVSKLGAGARRSPALASACECIS